MGLKGGREGVNVHVFERGNEDVAEGNDLDTVRALFSSG